MIADKTTSRYGLGCLYRNAMPCTALLFNRGALQQVSKVSIYDESSATSLGL